MVKFTHLILLKVSPYYIYSTSEADATATAALYKNGEVVGICCAKGDQLEVKKPIQQTVLQPIAMQYISHALADDEEEALKEVMDAKDQPSGKAADQALRDSQAKSLPLPS